MLKYIFFVLIIFSLIYSQDLEATRNLDNKTFRFDFGLGIGNIKTTGTVSARIGMSYLTSNWGIIGRYKYLGGDTGEKQGFFEKGPKEYYSEKALLVSKRIFKSGSNMFHINCGLGWLSGEKLDTTKTSLKNIKNVMGIAYSLGFYLGTGKIGASINIGGNINEEASFLIIYASISFIINVDNSY